MKSKAALLQHRLGLHIQRRGFVPVSLTTLFASLSSRNPANFECRSRSTYASYCTSSWHRQNRPRIGPRQFRLLTLKGVSLRVGKSSKYTSVPIVVPCRSSRHLRNAAVF